MILLTTFGGCSLAKDSDAAPLAVPHRRALGLLAMVAASGPAGVTRERAAAVLWPDADPFRSRRSLAQAIYHLRQVTKRDDLFLEGAELRLNPAAVRCDRTDFDAAIRDGRLEDAVALYRGHFLDGFSIAGTDLFERWVDGERRDIQHRCADALRALAASARRDGDSAKEVAWCRRRSALDPLDSDAALALADALIDIGDPAGALRAIQIHESLLAQELELALPPAFADRMARVRELSSTRSSDVVRVATPARPVPRIQVEDTVAGPDERPPSHGTRRGHRSFAIRAAVAALLLLSAGVAIGRWSTRARHAPTPISPEVQLGSVAILPFAVDATVPSTGIGTEISTRLARTFPGDVGPRALDPGLVIDVVRDEPQVSALIRSRPLARALAQRLGAAEVIVGRVSGTATGIAVSAALLDVNSGSERASAEVAAAPGDIARAVDELAATLLAERELDAERARAVAGVDLGALRYFLRAEAAARDERHEEAVRLYAKAIEDDSSLVPAALGLVASADRFNAAEQHDRGLALAWAARNRLGERDRAFLVALAGPRYPEPSSADEQVRAWERAVTVAGDRATVWVDLGERFFYEGAALGVRGASARASAAFRRALSLDPDNAPALRHLIEIAARQGDEATLKEFGTESRLQSAGNQLDDYLRWRIAIARKDSATLERLRARFATMAAPSLRAIAMAVQHDAIQTPDGDRVLQVLSQRSALGSERLDLLLARHSLALNHGDAAAALTITDEIEDVMPLTRAHLRLRVLDALYADGDSVAGRAAAGDLARFVDAAEAADETNRSLQLADMCVTAQWRAVKERTVAANAAARRDVERLRAAGVARVTVPIGANPRACADIVDAMLAVAANAPDGPRRVAQLEGMTLAGPALSDARTYAPIAVARLAEQLGDRPRALAAVRRRGYLNGWPRYQATALRIEQRLDVRRPEGTASVASLRR